MTGLAGILLFVGFVFLIGWAVSNSTKKTEALVKQKKAEEMHLMVDAQLGRLQKELDDERVTTLELTKALQRVADDKNEPFEVLMADLLSRSRE